jgi:hypothetical protein
VTGVQTCALPIWSEPVEVELHRASVLRRNSLAHFSRWLNPGRFQSSSTREGRKFDPTSSLLSSGARSASGMIQRFPIRDSTAGIGSASRRLLGHTAMGKTRRNRLLLFAHRPAPRLKRTYLYVVAGTLLSIVKYFRFSRI